MAHRLISAIVVVLLILQGMALATADVVPVDSSQSMAHCAGHEESGSDCACCSDSEMMGINCAAQCTVAVCVSLTLPSFDLARIKECRAPDDICVCGPAYSPLNPPPIS